MASDFPGPGPETPGADSGVWHELVEKIRNQLGPRYWSTLDAAAGTLEGDVMVVRCADEFTLEELSCPEVSQVVREVAGKHLGRPVAARFLLSSGPQKTDKLEELIGRGSRFDSFTVT